MFFFFIESTSQLRKIKSLFWILVANTNLFCPFFLAYNLTCILRFAIYGWLTKHLTVLLVNSRMTLTLRGLNFIRCIFTWKLILYIDYMWLLFFLTFVFKCSLQVLGDQILIAWVELEKKIYKTYNFILCTSLFHNKLSNFYFKYELVNSN